MCDDPALKRLLDFLESEEGKKSLEEYALDLKRKQKVLDSQLERFHKNYLNRFNEIVEKICTKYESEKYRDYWYKKGIEPPETLYWFLFNYAKKYGRECTKKERGKLSSMFTSALYYINGYYFERVDGQGSFVHVIKEEK